MTPLRWLAMGEHAVAPGDEWLSPQEQAVQASMRFAKRRTEWRVARWTAKHALAMALDRAPEPDVLAGLGVRRSPEGAPVAVAGDGDAPVSISMTDRAGWAVTLLGPAGVDLGVDLELVEPRSAAFVADHLTAAEQALVASGPADVLANLVWSAKESALKVLKTGLRRSTHSVEVALVDEQVGGWSALRVCDVEGPVFEGWWQVFGVFVLTVASSRPLPPPVPLVDPPALVTATPVHSWMGQPLA